MIRSKYIPVFAFSLMLLSALSALSQDEGKSYYSRNDGSYESTASWSDQNHDGPRSGINPGCALKTGITVFIEDSLISECNPMSIDGNAQLLISNGGKLEVNGDLRLSGNASITIDANSTLTINGEITLTKEAHIIIDGRLNAHGNIRIAEGAEVCGSGNANVSGTVSGKGWCNTIHLLPIELIDFTASLNDDTNILLEWSPKLGTPSDKFILERSSNGMTFNEITTIKADNASKANDDPKRYLDANLKPGTYYYRVTQVNFLDVVRASKLIAVSIIKISNTGDCELHVNPNPCVPSCTVTLDDCPNGVFKTYVMDGAGRTISELIPVSKTKQKIEYHLNKDNFTMPGVYIIRATSQTDSLYKKVMIR